MDPKNLTKEYTNGEVTVVWKPGLCIHSTICWKGLPQVFKPAERPWVKMEGAGTLRIVEQVKRCPSGALSYYYNNGQKVEAPSTETIRVEPQPNGPLVVYGTILVKNSDGVEEQREGATAFCRCGQSKNKPYCDDSHRTNGFRG